jgi:hypothetical protein
MEEKKRNGQAEERLEAHPQRGAKEARVALRPAAREPRWRTRTCVMRRSEKDFSLRIRPG